MAAPLATPLDPATEAPAAPAPRFDYLPVALFGSVMGLTGLSVAWRLAAAQYGLPAPIADAIGWGALLAFLALALAYGAKAVTAWAAVSAEFRHPIAGNLFGTPLISLLLLPFVLHDLSPTLAAIAWIVGTGGMVGLALLIVGRWMGSRQQLAHATPAWMVPVVGLLDIPLAVPLLGLPHTQMPAMFGLSVGLFFALAAAASLAYASLSWRFVERPALALRHRGRPRPQAQPEPAQPLVAAPAAGRDAAPAA